MRVHANVFTEIGDSLFRVSDGSSEVHLDDGRLLSHLGSVSLMDDLRGDEEMRVGFVGRGKDHSSGFWSVKNSDGKSVHELTFVDAISDPASGLVESFPVLGEEEGFEDLDHLTTVLVIEEVENLSSGQHTTVLEILDQLLDNSGILKSEVDVDNY
jgi:hypothetical protein